jgi:aspartyl-tRNA(Asn)/glutamyl-tRNA(Gln) amidotransferase subunit B
MNIRFETVIGLEIHVQLLTRTKLFCGDAPVFGAEPNSAVCPVCLGLPGALPVLNAEAVALGVRAALGLHCDVHETSVFARKNYFYPDLPKGYQITQFDRPFATDGWLSVEGGDGEPRRIRIRRIHLEEDAGKSLHDRVRGATAIDLNRAGTPLVEIVTEPDLRTPAEARAFLVRLKQALEYLEVSDCNMDEGSLRVDANVSLRPEGGEELGTKTELKNLNSFSFVERALRREVVRQEGVLRAGGVIEQQSLLWDERRNEARPMRSKEGSHDYRYFPDPDLPPLVVRAEWLAGIRAALPEMPWDRHLRFRERFGLPAGHAEVLTSTREMADYYEAVVEAGADPVEAANWVMGDVLAALKEDGCSIGSFRVPAVELAGLLALLARATISRPIARQVFQRMVDTGESAAAIVRDQGLEQVRDPDAVAAWVEEVVARYPDEVARARAGEAKLLGFLVGQVMKRCGGKADPRLVSESVRTRIG